MVRTGDHGPRFIASNSAQSVGRVCAILGTGVLSFIASNSAQSVGHGAYAP